MQRIALVMTIFGAVNWGLIAFFQTDLFTGIFGGRDETLAKVIDGLIGVAGLVNLGLFLKK
ncbi:DUF378 domain-containing protein [Bacillus sp. JJ1764]|uniref:DUF378 domain-containing protein n=1 Tax=Bacillus sp. JJ1764 TaxID=3122964 RepID=UPI002FFE9B22